MIRPRSRRVPWPLLVLLAWWIGVPLAGWTLSEPPGAFVGNRSSRIVHRAGCPFERRMSGVNRMEFRTLDEARGGGYRPCRRCLRDWRRTSAVQGLQTVNKHGQNESTNRRRNTWTSV